MTKPIHPNDAKYVPVIPDSVVSAFNFKLQHTPPNGDGWKVIEQGEMVDLILERDDTFGRHELFDKGYMDVEDLFRQNGWEVEYFKGYGFMNTKSYFHFRPAKSYET